MLVFDCEVYRNYTLISFMHTEKKTVVNLEKYEGQVFDRKRLLRIIKKNTIIGFNSRNYDLPILAALLDGWDCEHIQSMSSRIVNDNKPGWFIAKGNNLALPKIDHIDLIDVAPGFAGLKLYGGRLNAPKLQDLPIDPYALILPDQHELLRRYCINDLETTLLLYNTLKNDIDLRREMSKQYGMDLRSAGAAKIAREVLRYEMESAGNVVPHKPEATPDVIRYNDPGWFDFDDINLNTLFNRILKTRFELSEKGQPLLPEFLKKPIEYNGRKYKFGIGGLHSQETKQTAFCGKDESLFDADVASMYPNIILNQNLYPQHLGERFINTYRDIVKRRLAAKASGDKTTSDALKIVANSTFGMFSNPYLYLYSPNLLLQTTISGQLSLIMLIERVTQAGGDVVSANTDGVVVKCNKNKEHEIRAAMFDWELNTGLALEETQYRSLHSQNVNNYIAITTSGEVKRKGCFAKNGLAKNPQMPIIYRAVENYIKDGDPIESTITQCCDVTQFITIRKVKGGAVYRNEPLGSVIRYYWHNKEALSEEPIRYASNGNKVPKSDGAVPMMNMSDSFPNDVDFDRYIKESEKILRNVGHA